MKHISPRLTFALTVCLALVFWTSQSIHLSGSSKQGVYVTRNGFRMPVYGMSLIHDANGNQGTSCQRLEAAQIDAMRFDRHVSRAMAVNSPHAVIGSTTGGATFEITYIDPQGSGFNDGAQGETRRRALEAAVLAWTKVIQGTVTIKVSAVMEQQDDGDGDASTSLLASAGSTEMWLVDGKAVPSALAWQLTGKRNKEAADSDIEVNVNSDINWDYALNGVSARDKTSFVYTLIHEIGHGLGFLDTFDSETGELLNGIPSPYDMFISRGSSSPNLIKDHNLDRVLDDLVSDDLFFSGPAAVDASRRSIKPLPMIKLYAPDPYEPGSSIAHVDQKTYADLKTGLMTPADFGSGSDKIDILTLGIIKDMGYQLVPNAVTARVPQ